MVPVSATIEQIQMLEEKTPLTEECVNVALERYGVHPLVLSLILKVEGGYSGARIRNTDGSFDLGLAQINTIHLPELRKYGLTENMLRNNDCISFGVAAWHVNRVAQGQKIDSEEAFYSVVARYHSKTPRHNENYSRKLMSAAEDLIKQIEDLHRGS